MIKKVQISKPLCMLFNESLHQNIFPTDWKLAHVIPLFKAGDKSFPSNYRPVSLLSCVSNLLEKIVFKHIFNHLQGNKLLCKFQSGKFTMSCKESLSFAMCPIDVSSANNLPKPVIPSAMSFINTKNNNGPKTDP
jgi:hypothetical protein